jgi:cell division protein FtsW
MDYATPLSTGRFRELKAPSPVDYVLILTVLLLVGFGLVMVYSTTGIVSQERMGDALYSAKRQTFSALLGLGLMFVCMRIPLHFLRAVAPYLFAVSICLLALPLLPGISDRAGGASRWVRFGPVRFQPAEFVKVCMVIFMAGFFARHESKITSFVHGIIKPFSLVGLAAALLLMQPDFGSSAVIIVVVLAMALASGVRLAHMMFCTVVVAVVMGLLVFISPYRMM